MNAHFDRAFQIADEAFAKADEAFAEADRGFKEAKTGAARVRFDPGPQHTVRFTAHSWSERWRLFRVFFRLALTALFTGKSKLKFQAEPK